MNKFNICNTVSAADTLLPAPGILVTNANTTQPSTPHSWYSLKNSDPRSDHSDYLSQLFSRPNTDRIHPNTPIPPNTGRNPPIPHIPPNIHQIPPIPPSKQIPLKDTTPYPSRNPDQYPIIPPKPDPSPFFPSYPDITPATPQNPDYTPNPSRPDSDYRSLPQDPPLFRPFSDPDPDDPDPPDVDPDFSEQPFPSQPNPDPDQMSQKDYRKMLNYIVGIYPQAKGLPPSPRRSKALFEDIFSSVVEPEPLPSLRWFERVVTALQDADRRLHLCVETKRLDSCLLPVRKGIYSVYNNPSCGKFVPINDEFEALLDKPISNSRLVSISLKECSMLETSARSQSEALSHSMWVLSGLLGLIRRDGYLPSDPLLFQQLVRSVSMGLANQANFAASYTTYFVKKRRDLLLAHLPPVFQDVQKKALSKAPTCFSSSLFPPEELHSLVESAKAMAQFKSQQALADSLTRSARNRSPRRSSPDSYRRRYIDLLLVLLAPLSVFVLIYPRVPLQSLLLLLLPIVSLTKIFAPRSHVPRSHW